MFGGQHSGVTYFAVRAIRRATHPTVAALVLAQWRTQCAARHVKRHRVRTPHRQTAAAQRWHPMGFAMHSTAMAARNLYAWVIFMLGKTMMKLPSAGFHAGGMKWRANARPPLRALA